METNANPQNAQTNSVVFTGIIVDGQAINKRQKTYADGSIGETCGLRVVIDEVSPHPIIANFTTKNSKGEIKELPGSGEQVAVYVTQVPSIKEDGKFVTFREIGQLVMSNDEVEDAFAAALAKRAESEFKEQGI